MNQPQQPETPLPQPSSPEAPQESRQPQPPGKRRRWLPVVLGLVIFLSGTVFGACGALMAVRNRVLHAVHHPEEMPPRVAARLRAKLGLSDEQTAQVQQVLAERQQAFQAIRRDVQPKVVAELDRLETDVAAILDEDQRAEWRERFDQLRDTWIPDAPEGPSGNDGP